VTGSITRRPGWAPSGLIATLGLLSAGIYLFAFTRRWSLVLLYNQPYLDYAFLSRYTREGQAIYLGAFFCLFALQYVAYRAARGSPSTCPLWLILTGQCLFGLLMVAIYPVAAIDVYDYLMYGRIALVYGENPFIHPPSAFPDPLVGFSPWPNEPSVYGPIWQLVSLVPTALSGGGLLAGMVAFKVTALAFYVACTVVIWRLLRGLNPEWAPAGVLLFAWNPLLQFELPGNAHNDAAMVLFVLLAVAALVAGARLLVFPALAAAVLTKVLAIALGPVFLVGLLSAPTSWRRRARGVIGGGALAVLLIVVTYAPFWEGTGTLHFLSRGNWFTASLPTMLREYLRGFMEFEAAGRLAATLTGAGFALFVLIRVAWYWRSLGADTPNGGRWKRWLETAHDATFAYLAFACLWWEPWYLTWLVALAALVPRSTVHERALLFCYGGVINYVVFKYIWPVYQPMTYTQIMGISVVAIFGLPLLHLAATFGLGGRRQPSSSMRQGSAASPAGG
jgi:alpha-1,6-mannosyltransferase